MHSSGVGTTTAMTKHEFELDASFEFKPSSIHSPNRDMRLIHLPNHFSSVFCECRLLEWDANAFREQY